MKNFTGHVIIAGLRRRGQKPGKSTQGNPHSLHRGGVGWRVDQTCVIGRSASYCMETPATGPRWAGPESRGQKSSCIPMPDHQSHRPVGPVGAELLNPEVFIMVKTRFSSQVDELKKAGANQVIPEEFETSIEIFSRVLREFRMPNNIIEQQVELIRLGRFTECSGGCLSIWKACKIFPRT